MAISGKKIDKETIALIVAEWRTGNYSQRDLAYRHKVSVGLVNKHTKDVECDAQSTVNKMVQAKQELSLMNEQTVNAVHEVVNEQTKHIQFFNHAAITNVQEAMVHECNNQNDYRARAETILKGKETVLGKTPDTAIQINNNVQGNGELDKLRRLTPQQLEQAESLARIMESSNE